MTSVLFGVGRLTTGDGRREMGAPARLAGLAAAALAMALAAAPAGAVCVGDCNGDGRVSIADVQACVNRGAGLAAPPCAAADQNLDGGVDANEVDLCLQSFLDASTCPMVFTPVPTNTATNTVGPTVTNTPVPPPTNTVPPAETATPTPTPTIGELTCNLVGPVANSGIQIHIAALPVPLSFPITGSIAIGAGPADGSGAGAASCSVVNLGAINIPSIGFVCISPGSGCPLGRRDCDGGTPLGIDVQSDGNAGACADNATCQAICNTQCGGAAGVLSAACTGSCSGPTPQTCVNDADCLNGAGDEDDNGACNGPDNLSESQANLCQCTCVDTAAHGPSAAGDLQCNLGSSLVVETGAPCGGTDVLIAVGSTCIPVTTQRASSLISNSNFSDGMVPNPPNVNDLEGVAVSCATLDGGSLTGLSGVGAVNFFGSALGDLSVGLKATCQ